MSLEMVKEIKEAEAKAEQIKKEAVAQAKQIAQDSQKACHAVMEAAKADAAATRAKTLVEADAQAEEEGRGRRAKVSEQCNTITAAASSKTESAVSIIMEKIITG